LFYNSVEFFIILKLKLQYKPKSFSDHIYQGRNILAFEQTNLPR